MKKIICDKCKCETEDKENILFECFDGSLKMDNFDLCNKCWDKLQEIINKFTEK